MSSEPEQKKGLEDRAPLLVLFLSLFLTGVGMWVAYQAEQERDRLRFELAIEATEENLRDRIDSYLGVVWAEVGLFQANDLQVGEPEFRKFRIAADWGGRIDGLAGLAFIQKVEPENKEAFLEKMRLKHPYFNLHPKPPEGETIYAATLLESLTEQIVKKTALGFNPYSDPVRRAALLDASRTGEASITDKVVLKSDQLNGLDNPAIIMYAPVYFSGAELLPRKEREHLVYGFASASFHLRSLVERIRMGSVEEQLGFRITTQRGNNEQSVLIDTNDREPDQLQQTRDLVVAGSRWSIQYWSLPSFFRGNSTFHVQLVAFAGILLSLTLFSLATVQARARKAREAALRIEKQRARDLEEMDKAKTVFFSNLNHELRTPLNGILGMSHLLYDTKLDEQQQDFLNSIASCGKALMDLISDVLDLSKVRAGKMDLRLSPTSLHSLFQQAIQVVRGPAQGKGVELKLDWDENLPEVVETDEMRFRQVLVNLLGNAVKFTNEGSVTLRAVLAEPETLVFEVQDTGIGIAQDDIKLLFRPFSQVPNQDAHPEQKGTGLGLHLCREILELMDGTISVESTLGEGTTFRGRVPLKVCDSNPYETQKIPQINSLPRPALQVLVVDDNPINRKVLALQLEKLGQNVAIAENGQHAVEKVLKEEFDLVLMDCQMPEMDGLEATRQIRESGGYQPIIVALTAYTEESRRQACQDAGMDAFLTKPVEAGKLKALVETYSTRPQV